MLIDKTFQKVSAFVPQIPLVSSSSRTTGDCSSTDYASGLAPPHRNDNSTTVTWSYFSPVHSSFCSFSSTCFTFQFQSAFNSNFIRHHGKIPSQTFDVDTFDDINADIDHDPQGPISPIPIESNSTSRNKSRGRGRRGRGRGGGSHREGRRGRADDSDTDYDDIPDRDYDYDDMKARARSSRAATIEPDWDAFQYQMDIDGAGGHLPATAHEKRNTSRSHHHNNSNGRYNGADSDSGTRRNDRRGDRDPQQEKNLIIDPDPQECFIGSSPYFRQDISEKLNQATKLLKSLSDNALDPAHHPSLAVENDPSFISQNSHRQHIDNSPPIRNRVSKDVFQQRQSLPAFAAAPKILEALEQHQVILVTGETGCGKTTQIPQFILDPELHIPNYKPDPSKPYPNIICTQPRRISTISVAERIAKERNDLIGNTVGWQIRFENKMSSKTRLLFCTTGIILRRLQRDPLLQGCTHLLVDEVHERSIDSDFLLILLKDLLVKRSDMRVILMSATLRSESFKKYFDNCPHIHIKGRTYPVTTFFLEDIFHKNLVKQQTLYNAFQERKKSERLRDDEIENRSTLRSRINIMTHHINTNRKQDDLISERVIRDILTFEEDDDYQYYAVLNDLLPPIVRGLEAKEERGAAKGSILIFVAGWKDIATITDVCADTAKREKLVMMPLHGDMDTDRQRRVFDPSPPGLRKVVVSTNIAETSVTINDIVCVIDFGIHKETTYDADNNISVFRPTFISQANAVQRRGRAGRVRPGVCFHMFSSVKFKRSSGFQLPEMRRTPLENLILQVVSLGYTPVEEFLSKALEPPTTRAINHAVDLLRRMGAMEADRQALTPLGKVLATLPLPPQIGKVLVLGVLFGCKDAMLNITAFASVGKSTFRMVQEDQLKSLDRIRRKLSLDHKSDHLMRMRLYQQYQESKAADREKEFISDNFLGLQAFRRIDQISHQFENLLKESGVIDFACLPEERSRHIAAYSKEDWLNRNGDHLELLKLLICAGFFPNIVRVDSIQENRHRFVIPTGKANANMFSVGNLYSNGQLPHHWGVYLEKRRNLSTIEIMDFTPVPPIAMILFSDRFHFDKNPGSPHSLIHIDKWIAFKTMREDMWAVQTMVQLRWCINAWLSPALRSRTLNRRDSRLVQRAGELMVQILEQLMSDSETTEEYRKTSVDEI